MRTVVVWVPPLHAVIEGAVDNTADLVVAGRTVAWRLTRAELAALEEQVSDAIDRIDYNAEQADAELHPVLEHHDEAQVIENARGGGA